MRPVSASGPRGTNRRPRVPATTTACAKVLAPPSRSTTEGREPASMKTGLEIAQEASLEPIADVAAAAGILPEELRPYGTYRAKVALSVLDRLADRPDGKLVITTAITPTKAGEGKTTTSISLTQGLGALGKDVALCLREPPKGPVFGIKAGGTGR